jgi:ribonuclease HI
VGVLLISPSGDKLRYALQLHFWATNNVAEYDALLHGIRVAIERGAWCLFVQGDSVGASSVSELRGRAIKDLAPTLTSLVSCGNI